MNFVGGVGYTNIDLIYSDMDRLPGLGEEVYAGGFGVHLGGGCPATLINTTRLGVPSRILTFVGKDTFSEFATKFYQSYDADIVNLYEGDGVPVVVTSVMVCNNDRSFATYRDEKAVDEQAICEKVYQHLSGAKVVNMHVGFLDAYKKLKEEGTILIFDTGWEDDLSVEKYEEYLKIADYYLPNQKEALKITGTESVEEAAKVLSRYFENVTIKLDKDGCMLQTNKGTQVIPPMQDVVAVDSTGAGDAFMSGFMYGLYHDYPLDQCIRFGNVTGGTCVQGVGCLTKYVDEQQLLEKAAEL